LLIGTDRIGTAVQTAPAACQLFERIPAAVLWLAQGGSHGFAERLALQQAIRPVRIGPGWTDPRRVVLVRRAAADRGQRLAVVGLDREAVVGQHGESTTELLNMLTDVWPELQVDDASAHALPVAARHAPGAGYANGLAPGHGLVLWLSRDLLEQATGHPFKAQRLAYYRGRGVSVVDVREGARLVRQAADTRHVVQPPEAWQLMARHMTTAAVAPLESLIRDGVRVTIVDDGLRLRMLASAASWFCTTPAIGSRPSAAGAVSCWQLRNNHEGGAIR
jgi:hypothetical protein